MTKETGSDLVVIEVMDEIDDAIPRIVLLNNALFQVLSNVRLIRVLDADYAIGRIRLLTECHRSRPRVTGKVSVKFEPVDDANCIPESEEHKEKS